MTSLTKKKIIRLSQKSELFDSKKTMRNLNHMVLSKTQKNTEFTKESQKISTKKKLLEGRILLRKSIPRMYHPIFSSRNIEDFSISVEESSTKSLKKFWNTEHNHFVTQTTKDTIFLNPSRHSFPLQHAISFLKASFSKSRPQSVIFVGSDGWSGEIASSSAYKSQQAFVNIKWLPGLLTNWATTYNSIQNFKKIAVQIKKGVELAWKNSKSSSLSKSVDLSLTVQKLSQMYERHSKFLLGLRKLSARPSLIIVLDSEKNQSAIREAQRCGIPVIALVNGGSSISSIDYPIPCIPNSKIHVYAIADILSNVIISSSEKCK